MIINNNNNPILPNGLAAFDIRSSHNNFCAFGQKSKPAIETPVRLGAMVMSQNWSIYFF